MVNISKFLKAENPVSGEKKSLTSPKGWIQGILGGFALFASIGIGKFLWNKIKDFSGFGFHEAKAKGGKLRSAL